jgi:beta-mannanase
LDEFPLAEVAAIGANGSVPLITWEPWVNDLAGNLNAIAAGTYEIYIRDFLLAAKTLGKPLLLRFAHEMNGNWYPWDGAHNGAAAEAAERYKKAWIYIYNVKQRIGANNVRLVWCPNNLDIPAEEWNQQAAYYPGDQYVDWIGMDGYNWGYGGWQSFNDVFASVYQKLTALSAKPLLIGEFASAEQGGAKDKWINEALSQLPGKYPRVKLFCWFNINKERDWRINSSVTAEAAFRQSVSSSYFRESLL